MLGILMYNVVEPQTVTANAQKRLQCRCWRWIVSELLDSPEVPQKQNCTESDKTSALLWPQLPNVTRRLQIHLVSMGESMDGEAEAVQGEDG